MTASDAHKQLLKMLYTDELTRIYNRRYLKEQIPRYLAQAKQKNLPVAFYMFDLDNFKGINDTYGHQTGDRALVHFARIIVGTFKRIGIPIRYAGDEFVVVAPGVDRQRAKALGEMVEKGLSATPLVVEGKQIKLGCSIGVAIFPANGEDVDTLFARADEALYISKHQGKGRVTVYPESGRLLTPEKLDSILSSPCIVGRDEILSFVDSHFTPQGNPKIFPIVHGPAGSGKSRIIRYARERARKNLAFCMSGRGYSFWQSEPYGAIFSTLSSFFETNQEISNFVFESLDADAKAVLKPRIFAWDSKPLEGAEPVENPSNVEIYESLMKTFLILGRRGTGAVLLDDADQIDPPSLQLFDALFAEENVNVLFMMALNADDAAEADEKTLQLLGTMKNVSRLGEIRKFELSPLTIDDIREFVSRTFGGAGFPPEVEEQLLRNSGGNPLFIVETMSYLLQTGKIYTDGDNWILGGVTADDIPLHFEELLKMRLMQIKPEELDVLKLASIMGEKISAKQLGELTGLNPHQVMDILGNARRLLLIEETPNPDEYVFSHKMVRSVLYSLLSEEEKKKYHILAAEIEKKYSEGALERVVGRLAYHYQNAGELEKAASLFSTFKDQMDSVLIFTSSMAKESPLAEEDLGKAVETARAFKVAMQNLRLYPRENQNVIKSVQRLKEALDYFLAEKTEALSISLTAETMVFNGQPPPPDKNDARLTQELYSQLSSYGLQGVLFIRGLTEEEIIDFLEVFTQKPEEVATRWDEIVEEKKLEHILPDRKVFVAVGEHKIVLDSREVIARTLGEEGGTGEKVQQVSPQFTEEQIQKIQNLVEEFKKDKEELIAALRSGNLDNQVLERLISLLERISGESVLTAPVQRAEEKKPAGAEKKVPKSPEERYADVLPDMELVEQSEADIELAFDDLVAEDTLVRAKAAAWLIKQPPEKVVPAAVEVVCSPHQPLKKRKLAAAVVAKMGKKAVDMFLDKISPAMPEEYLINFLNVAELFAESPKFFTKLQELVISAPEGVVKRTFALLRRIPNKAVNQILVELFSRATGKLKIEVLGLIAERGIREIVPELVEIIKPVKMWEQERQVQLQVYACNALGILRATEAEDALIAAAQVPKPWTLLKPKPEPVRIAAIKALKNLPPDEKIAKLFESLKKDKSPAVRKTVG